MEPNYLAMLRKKMGDERFKAWMEKTLKEIIDRIPWPVEQKNGTARQ